jgi:hypothetical protein
LVLVALTLLGVTACATTPGAPPTVDVTGSWAGQWAYEQATLGGGQIELQLTQKGANVQGNMDISGSPRVVSGPFSGVVQGNQLRILDPTSITGRLTVQSDTMAGEIDGTSPARMSLRRVK